MNNPEIFYQRQKQHTEKELQDLTRKAIHDSWFREDTVDFWRHERMYKTIEPIAKFYKDAEWVSIGDGRFGLDSYRLRKMFGFDVLPTDIAENMIERGRELGLFGTYSVENAEALSFKDNSFDFVFCKEALHHMPRPLMAVYEMIRVCRKAVILIEPGDPLVYSSPMKLLKMLPQQLSTAMFPDSHRKSLPPLVYPTSNFEPSGNYIYRISKREMVKVIQGLNMPGLAWKGINDHYIAGCEFEIADSQNPMFKKVLAEIKKQDEKCRRFPLFFDHNLSIILLFKEEITPDLKINMLDSGFEFPKIKKNPFVDNYET